SHWRWWLSPHWPETYILIITSLRSDECRIQVKEMQPCFICAVCRRNHRTASYRDVGGKTKSGHASSCWFAPPLV
ncbi:hypothetical protein Nmel_007719, partial [Mimus melanotis]